jgi:hypothetical protein
MGADAAISASEVVEHGLAITPRARLSPPVDKPVRFPVTLTTKTPEVVPLRTTGLPLRLMLPLTCTKVTPSALEAGVSVAVVVVVIDPKVKSAGSVLATAAAFRASVNSHGA